MGTFIKFLKMFSSFEGLQSDNSLFVGAYSFFIMYSAIGCTKFFDYDLTENIFEVVKKGIYERVSRENRDCKRNNSIFSQFGWHVDYGNSSNKTPWALISIG